MCRLKCIFHVKGAVVLGCLALAAAQASAAESPWFGEVTFGRSDAQASLLDAADPAAGA